MLIKEPEMLLTDAFYEHTMQQHATVVGARGSRWWKGLLAGGSQRFPDPSWFKGVASWRSRDR